MDSVEEIRNRVREVLTNEMIAPRHDMKTLHDKLAKEIDNWEEESTNKIRKMASEARNELSEYIMGRMTNIRHRFDQLTNELQQDRQINAFVETDLHVWEDKLNQLKEEIINLPNVVIEEDHTKLISNIRVNLYKSTEIFERSSGNADFTENGKVVYLKSGPDTYTDVRGKREYTIGQHTLSLKIEQLNGWILFGIISKSAPLEIHSYASPSCYGWYNGDNFVYAAGQLIDEQGSDAVQNDTVHLVIDCDNRLIRLINERTNQTLELPVDINECPFPWQLHLNLNLKPTRIRIVS